MPDEIFLDASDMEPPLPLAAAVKLLVQLRPGEYLRMAHRMIPYPLFDYCREHALKYRVLPGTTASYDIFIWHAEDGDIPGGQTRNEP
jgi:hypothetical protein